MSSSCTSCGDAAAARPPVGGSASFPALADCPMRMSDGRSFTDYASSKCAIFNTIPYGTSSFASRQYMIEHADDLIKTQRQVASQGICPCPPNPVPVPGEQWVVRCTPQTCTRAVGDAAGLGDGRNFK